MRRYVLARSLVARAICDAAGWRRCAWPWSSASCSASSAALTSCTGATAAARDALATADIASFTCLITYIYVL